MLQAVVLIGKYLCTRSIIPSMFIRVVSNLVVQYIVNLLITNYTMI